MPDEVMFVHSKCCGSHWELVYNPHENKYALQCDSCGKSIGSSIKIEGPSLSDCECLECQKKRTGNN